MNDDQTNMQQPATDAAAPATPVDTVSTEAPVETQQKTEGEATA